MIPSGAMGSLARRARTVYRILLRTLGQRLLLLTPLAAVDNNKSQILDNVCPGGIEYEALNYRPPTSRWRLIGCDGRARTTWIANLSYGKS